MNTSALKKIGHLLFKFAKLSLVTLASRPKHVYGPLLDTSKRK